MKKRFTKIPVPFLRWAAFAIRSLVKAGIVVLNFSSAVGGIWSTALKAEVIDWNSQVQKFPVKDMTVTSVYIDKTKDVSQLRMSRSNGGPDLELKPQWESWLA